ncbi:MAG: acyl-CoA dehydrogenase family protein [Actinobacteria bacterium]|nr:acyl-CoA dehydrogenase family protein [Actinomycetota bacterium]
MPFDLQLTEEQEALKATLHEFSEDVLRPAARPCEEAKETSPDIHRQVHELGVTAPVPEEFGGGGTFDCVTYCVAAEELAFGDPGIAYQVLGSGIAAIVLGLAGDDDHKARLLPRFAEPEPVPSFVAYGEKVALGDLESLETAIDADKVRGEKYGVLNASDASLGIVVGRTPDGLGAIVFEGNDGYDVAKPENKMGLEAAPTYAVRFDDAGEALPAGPQLEQAILWTKLMTGAIAVGCARASFEHAAKYATEREAFGKPIGAFQAISHRIADMAIEIDAARLSVWRAAWKIDRGEATHADVAQANGQALQAASYCGDEGVQVLGGHGYIRDHPVEKWFRDAVTLSVFDPPELGGDTFVARSVFA